MAYFEKCSGLRLVDNVIDNALSGNCYKVRLLLNWLELEYETQAIDFYPGFEHTTDEFLKINPLGQLPVIEDQGVVIRDAQAILVHLATTYNNPNFSWYPEEQATMAGQIQSWLAFADSITATCSAARLHDAMFFDIDVDKARKGGERILRVLDEHLWAQKQGENAWPSTKEHPSIADIACFPYVALCEEGGISQTPFPAIQRWLERFMRLEGFAPMAGMLPLQVPAMNN